MLRLTSPISKTIPKIKQIPCTNPNYPTAVNTRITRTIKTKNKGTVKVTDKSKQNTSTVHDPETDKEFLINYTPYQTLYKMPKYNNPPPIVALPPGPPPPKSAFRRYTAPVGIVFFLGMSVYIYVNADDEVIQYWKDVDEGKVHPFDLMQERIEEQANRLEEERNQRLGVDGVDDEE